MEVLLNDEPVSATFHVDGHEMTAELLRRVEKFVADTGRFDRLARAAIREDYARGEDTKCRRFLSDHLKRLHPDDRAQVFGTASDSSIGVEHLLAALDLFEVELYPEMDEGVASFHYILGSGITDYIICVEFNNQGEFLGLGVSS